ncbi:MAG: translation initiation factor IF-2, partial [Rickettsiales bacterium]|nr:translation initiation factor IF-2 [Rickettsiales bacterium]
NTITLSFKKSNKTESTKISGDSITLLEERRRALKEAQAKNIDKNMRSRGQNSHIKNDTKSTGAIADSQEKNVDSKNSAEETIEKVEEVNVVEGNEEKAKEENQVEFISKNEPEHEAKHEPKFIYKSASKSYKKNATSGQRNVYNADKKVSSRPGKRVYTSNSLERGRFASDDNSNDRNSSGESNDEKSIGKRSNQNSKNFSEDAGTDFATTTKSAELFSSKKNIRGDGRSKAGKNDFDEANLDKLDKKISKDRYEKYSKNIHTYIFNDDIEDNFRGKFGKFRKKDRRNNPDNNYSQQKIFINVNIPEFISVSDLAERMNEKKSDIIKKLLTMGVKATANQTIDADTAELVAIEFGHSPNRVLDSDVEDILDENVGTEFVPRNPVVTVMGHVDHGKTSLLDAMRTTNIAESESGGITQHIGASRVDISKDKFITFIDTPGHEAFTEMRMRGANVTDIVVLVVAADDGVKDQTIEAINHTRVAKVPIIVAINKIDKIGANPDRVKQELLQYDIVAEEFGGNTIFVNVSARDKINIDRLLEAILFQAEILNLKAPIDCRAGGAVIESKMDARRGVVTTVLVQKGILQVGDIVLANTSYGKIKKIIDDRRKVRDSAYPSMAVEIFGLDMTPSAGVVFDVVSTEKEARDIISYRERKERESKENRRATRTMENMLKQVSDSNKKQFSLILKTDVSGSIEAIVGSLLKLSNNEINIEIIHSAIGSLTESDINLAKVSNAMIVAFNVRANNIIKEIAKEKGVEIKYYSIIYDIIDDIRLMMSGLLEPVTKEKIIGQAEVRNIIRITNVGNIAGCFVTDGEIHRNANIRLVRDGIVIFDGKIKTLKRFKEDVREVKNNYECGLAIENYDDVRENDTIECYEKVKGKK